MKKIYPVLLGLIFCFTVQYFPCACAGEEVSYLVAMDFKSDFDKGHLGRQVGKMIRMKSVRRKLFVADAEIEWEDLAANMENPGLDAQAATVAGKAKEAYGCDVVLWGEIEKPDAKKDALLLHVRGVNLKSDSSNFVINTTYECENQYALRLKVDEILKVLTGALTPADIRALDPSNRMEPFGPNLCALGNMEFPGESGIGVNASLSPKELEKIMKSAWTPQRVQELKRLYKGWAFPVAEGVIMPLNDKDGYNGLAFYMSTPVADITGLYCHTEYIPVKSDTYYQVSFRVKTYGSQIKLFVKGYRDLQVKGYEGVKTLRQETFKHHKVFYGESGKWEKFESKPFLPRSVRKDHMPQFIRVQPYAYHPKGIVLIDDIVVQECRERK